MAKKQQPELDDNSKKWIAVGKVHGTQNPEVVLLDHGYVHKFLWLSLEDQNTQEVHGPYSDRYARMLYVEEAQQPTHYILYRRIIYG